MALAQARVIRGAVATLGVSERVSFLRKTYAHLGVALLAFVALTAGLMQTEWSLNFSQWAFSGNGAWLLVMVAFMAIGMVAQRLATSPSSSTLQYVGLGVAVVAQAVIMQPMLWVAYYTSKSTADFQQLVLTASVITAVIFVGLTATVFVTRKDFSFMRGGLMIASFAMLGLIGASMLFGFQLGLVFCAFGIAVLAGYVLYQTSIIMAQFPPRAHVAAALMLFSTIATLFWYVLQFLMSLNRR